jgi:hypothetical protein
VTVQQTYHHDHHSKPRKTKPYSLPARLGLPHVLRHLPRCCLTNCRCVGRTAKKGGEAKRSRAGRGEGQESKMTINPMHKAHAAPRCKAKSKRTGKPCRAPAVRGWQVCRMHGARGGAPEGKRNGNYRHGARSKETLELRKLIKSLR